MEYTKGPWKWIESEELYGEDGRYLGCSSQMARLINYDGQEICNFGNSENYYPSEGKEPSLADKKIMAASPKLLEASKAALYLLNAFVGPDDKLGMVAITLLSDAISEALHDESIR